MWKPGLYLLLVLADCCNCLQYVRRQTFTAKHAVSGRTALEIDIQVPGKIQWKSDSSNRLQFMVTSRATEPQELNKLQVKFEDSEDAVLLSVKSLPREPFYAARGSASGSTQAFVTSFPVLLLLAGIGCLWPTNGCGIRLSVLFLIWLVHDPGGSVVETRLLVDKDASVTILVPREFVFEKVGLYVSEGEIETDPTLAMSKTSLECSTMSRGQTGCDHCCSGRGICAEFNQCLCYDGYNGTACEKQMAVEYTIYINPDDIRLLSTRTKDGNVIDLYGKRTENGAIRSLNALKVRRNDGRQTTVTLGKKYRVKRITSSTGSRLDLHWRGRSRVYVKAVTPDGLSQVNVDVRVRRRRHGTSTASRRRRRNVNKLQLSGDVEADKRQFRTFQHQYLHIPVRVLSCDVPEPDAEVFANVYLNYHSGSWDGAVEYRALPTKVDGVFYIQIPNNPASRAKDSKARACSSIGNAALKSCSKASPRVIEYQQSICNATANGFLHVPNADPDQVKDVLETCKDGFQAVESHCKTIDFTPEKQYNPAFDCDKVKTYADSYTDQPIFVSPVVVYPDGHVLKGKGVEIKITRNMVYHENGFILDDNGGGVKLTDIVVDPSDPKPKERYRVRVTHRCASNKTSLYASVAGSDFYTNEMACVGYTECNCCELVVAGAAELVVDSVQVHIEDPALKAPISRHVVVVF